MLKKRLIPALLLSERRLVKTVKFMNPVYVGDPINTVKIFNDKEVDELFLLDISRTCTNSPPDFEYLRLLASECFMPLSYGGGITTLDHASQVFDLGIEKIVLQSAIFINPSLVQQIASRYGSQSIVISLDIKKTFFGKYKLYNYQNTRYYPHNIHELISRMVDLGAGEILLSSVNKEGTLSGPDLIMIRSFASITNVPIVFQGGIASLADVSASISAGADSLAAGAFFVFYGPHRAVLISYPNQSLLQSIL